MSRWPLMTTCCLSLGLSACVLNSAHRIAPEKVKALPGRAVLLFSVALRAPWSYKNFAIELDRYDLRKQDISGNCYHFDRVQGSVNPQPNTLRHYFAFIAPPGAYTFSPFNGSTLGGPPRAYIAPAGRVTFIGDFTYVGARAANLVGHEVELSDDLVAAENTLHATMTLSKVVNISRPHPFLCTP